MEKIHELALNSMVAFPRCLATGFTAVANSTALGASVMTRYIDTYRHKHRHTDIHRYIETHR